jgi:hypothetical protein
MLAELQQQLSDIYRVGRHYDVRDYVITDPALAKYLGQDAILTNTDETLLVSQDDDGLALSLFLDGDMLERVESTNPLACLQAESLDDLWKVLEGISHFNCVVWKAEQDRTVTLLELELQGEIDKFVSTMLLANEQADAGLLNGMHSWLFDNVRFNEGLDAEQLKRYQSANDYAGRYCHRLRQQLIDDESLVLPELRQFYRLQLSDKISHIHSQAWAA